jgi:hypothetical protein
MRGHTELASCNFNLERHLPAQSSSASLFTAAEAGPPALSLRLGVI